MKVIILVAFAALASATSQTYTTGAGRNLQHSELTATRIQREPERISRVQETVHQESGDALGNRVGEFVTEDNEGNLRRVRYAAGPAQVYSGHQQQRATVYGIPWSHPERYSYDSGDRTSPFGYGRIPSSRSVSFITPPGSTYSHYPQFPRHGIAVGRYF